MAGSAEGSRVGALRLTQGQTTGSHQSRSTHRGSSNTHTHTHTPTHTHTDTHTDTPHNETRYTHTHTPTHPHTHTHTHTHTQKVINGHTPSYTFVLTGRED